MKLLIVHYIRKKIFYLRTVLKFLLHFFLELSISDFEIISTSNEVKVGDEFRLHKTSRFFLCQGIIGLR